MNIDNSKFILVNYQNGIFQTKETQLYRHSDYPAVHKRLTEKEGYHRRSFKEYKVDGLMGLLAIYERERRGKGDWYYVAVYTILLLPPPE